MIKVVNVISDANIGGAGKCLLTFMKYCSRDKIDLTVVIPKGSLLKPEIEKLGGKYIEADGIADKSLSIGAVGSLLKIFNDIKPDIIHCHAAMSARIAGRIYGKSKIVYTRHSVFEPSPFLSKGIGKKINGFVNNSTADAIIAVAEAAKDNLLKTGVRSDKITVIQNGVEPLSVLSDKEKRRIKSNYNLKDGDFVLGIAARLTEVKGHIYILEALKLLSDDGIQAKLIIAGTGSFEESIREKIRQLNLEKNVIMAGFVQNVSELMNVLDVNVNASFGTEATSLALLEGMCLGLPAVVSDFGGNPGVITDGVNGYIFTSRDSRSMYEKLKLLTDEKTAEQMRVNCKTEFDKRFRAEVMTRKIEELYAELADKE